MRKASLKSIHCWLCATQKLTSYSFSKCFQSTVVVTVYVTSNFNLLWPGIFPSKTYWFLIFEWIRSKSWLPTSLLKLLFSWKDFSPIGIFCANEKKRLGGAADLGSDRNNRGSLIFYLLHTFLIFEWIKSLRFCTIYFMIIMEGCYFHIPYFWWETVSYLFTTKKLFMVNDDGIMFKVPSI